MAVELYKSGKGYKKVSKDLKMLISSVQALMKWIPNHGQVEQQRFQPQLPGKLFRLQRKTHMQLSAESCIWVFQDAQQGDT